MGMLKLLVLLTFFGKQLIRKVSKLARRDEAGDARLYQLVLSSCLYERD